MHDLFLFSLLYSFLQISCPLYNYHINILHKHKICKNKVCKTPSERVITWPIIRKGKISFRINVTFHDLLGCRFCYYKYVSWLTETWCSTWYLFWNIYFRIVLYFYQSSLYEITRRVYGDLTAGIWWDNLGFYQTKNTFIMLLIAEFISYHKTQRDI